MPEIREKKYVPVDVHFAEDGRIRPLRIFYADGEEYEIDRIVDISRRAAEVGGVGDRYVCMVRGRQTALWFEKGKWFVEAKANKDSLA